MTELDISDMQFNYAEIGDMIKASKGLYTWDFNLEGKRHKVELTHSRIKGKRVITCDGEEINSCLKYTYNYTYSFPLDGHYYTIIQISPDQYDLRIDNISYMILKNQNKRKKAKKYDDDKYEEKKSKKEKKKEKNNDDNFFNDAGDFDFGGNDNKDNDKVKSDVGNIMNDFDFGDSDKNNNNDKKDKPKNDNKNKNKSIEKLSINLLSSKNEIKLNNNNYLNTYINKADNLTNRNNNNKNNLNLNSNTENDKNFNNNNNIIKMPIADKSISNRISKLNLDIFTTNKENKENKENNINKDKKDNKDSKENKENSNNKNMINFNNYNSNKNPQKISLTKKSSPECIMRRNGTQENQIRIFNGIENENENIINGISTDNLIISNDNMNRLNDDEMHSINSNNNNYRRLNTDLFHTKNNTKRNEYNDKCKLLRSNKNLSSNTNREQKKNIFQIQSKEKMQQIQIKAKKLKINILYFLTHMIIP